MKIVLHIDLHPAKAKNHKKGKEKEKKRECEREEEREREEEKEKEKEKEENKEERKMEKAVLEVFSSTPPPPDMFPSTVPSLGIAREQHNSHKGGTRAKHNSYKR